MEDELRYEATHDALTGAMNRARFEERLQNELALAAHSGEAGAVLLIDLDEFKEVNDTFGHHAGDVVLQNTVQALRRHLRHTDTLARIGGDEFAIVLPQTPRGQAEQIAGRLLQALYDEVVSVGENSIRVHASIGIAAYPADAATVKDLLIKADDAMYAAKREGGHRLSG